MFSAGSNLWDQGHRLQQMRMYIWNLSRVINSKEDYVDRNLTLHTPVMASWVWSELGGGCFTASPFYFLWCDSARPMFHLIVLTFETQLKDCSRFLSFNFAVFVELCSAITANCFTLNWSQQARSINNFILCCGLCLYAHVYKHFLFTMPS